MAYYFATWHTCRTTQKIRHHLMKATKCMRSKLAFKHIKEKTHSPSDYWKTTHSINYKSSHALRLSTVFVCPLRCTDVKSYSNYIARLWLKYQDGC